MPRRFGKYHLLARLGATSFAEHFLARSAQPSGKLYLLRRLKDNLATDPHWIDYFLDMARQNAAIVSPNVLRVAETGQQENRYFAAIEFQPGLSLAAYLRRVHRAEVSISIDCAAGLVAQLATGLEDAYDTEQPSGRPIRAHGALSPHRIWVGFDGQVSLLDFPLERAAPPGPMVEPLMAYRSPEALRGDPIDKRSDVFSLGIFLFELTTGRNLFRRGSRERIKAAILSGRTPKPRTFNPALSPEVETIILRALDREPAMRFVTPGEMQQELLSAVQLYGGSVSPLSIKKLTEDTMIEEKLGQLNIAGSSDKISQGDEFAISAIGGIAESAVGEVRDLDQEALYAGSEPGSTLQTLGGDQPVDLASSRLIPTATEIQLTDPKRYGLKPRDYVLMGIIVVALSLMAFFVTR